MLIGQLVTYQINSSKRHRHHCEQIRLPSSVRYWWQNYTVLFQSNFWKKNQCDFKDAFWSCSFNVYFYQMLHILSKINPGFWGILFHYILQRKHTSNANSCSFQPSFYLQRFDRVEFVCKELIHMDQLIVQAKSIIFSSFRKSTTSRRGGTHFSKMPP